MGTLDQPQTKKDETTTVSKETFYFAQFYIDYFELYHFLAKKRVQGRG